jgi:hypothetical protein
MLVSLTLNGTEMSDFVLNVLKFIFIVAVLYFGMAFVNLSLVPSEWGFGSRLFVAFVYCCLFFDIEG